jgi:hypothetical protein
MKAWNVIMVELKLVKLSTFGSGRLFKSYAVYLLLFIQFFLCRMFVEALVWGVCLLCF